MPRPQVQAKANVRLLLKQPIVFLPASVEHPETKKIDKQSVYCNRDSPFKKHDNFGGGFGRHFVFRLYCLFSPTLEFASMPCSVTAASDDDRVALQSMRFATAHSAGATCASVQTSLIAENGDRPQRVRDSADDQVLHVVLHQSKQHCFTPILHHKPAVSPCQT